MKPPRDSGIQLPPSLTLFHSLGPPPERPPGRSGGLSIEAWAALGDDRCDIVLDDSKKQIIAVGVLIDVLIEAGNPY